MNVVLGIDVSKTKLDVCLRLADERRQTKVVSNNPSGFAQLLTWVTKRHAGPLHVCMEATNVYWEPVAYHLADAGYTVSVVNPAQIQAFARACLSRNKNDAVDARLIADYALSQQPLPWRPEPMGVRTIRAFVDRRQALVVMRTQEQNRLDTAVAAIRPSIEALIQTLEAEIKAIERQIRQHIDSDPTLKSQDELLRTIPGLGAVLSAHLLGFIGGPEPRFQAARQVTAFAGLDPRERRSGTSLHAKERISKIGHASLRRALYLPAVVAGYRTQWGKAFATRLAAAGKPAKVIITAVMRKLLTIAFAVLKSGKPFNPELHPT